MYLFAIYYGLCLDVPPKTHVVIVRTFERCWTESIEAQSLLGRIRSKEVATVGLTWQGLSPYPPPPFTLLPGCHEVSGLFLCHASVNAILPWV